MNPVTTTSFIDLNKSTPFQKQPFWKIDKVFCGDYNKGAIRDALQEIAASEGFSLKEPPVKVEWLRDSVYPITAERWIVPRYVSEDDFEKTRDLAKAQCPPSAMHHFWDLGFLGTVTALREYAGYEICSEFSTTPAIELSSLYFQGGNILKAEMKGGEKCHLIGAYNVTASCILLNETEEKVTKAFRELFVGKVHFLGLEKREQLAYHLDISLLPLMGGRVLVQDHDKSIQALEQELKDPALTQDEREQFRAYLYDARRLANIERERVIRTKDELEKAGFTPISVAANYYIEGMPRINYMNSLHGYGDKERSFVISMSFNTPGEARLQALFSKALEEQGVERIYYLPLPIATEMLESGGSIHCDTLEV